MAKRQNHNRQNHNGENAPAGAFIYPPIPEEYRAEQNVPACDKEHEPVLFSNLIELFELQAIKIPRSSRGIYCPDKPFYTVHGLKEVINLGDSLGRESNFWNGDEHTRHRKSVYMYDEHLVHELEQIGVRLEFDKEINKTVIPYRFARKPISFMGKTPAARYGIDLYKLSFDLCDNTKAIIDMANKARRGEDFYENFAAIPKHIQAAMTDKFFPWYGDLDDVRDYLGLTPGGDESLIYYEVWAGQQGANIYHGEFIYDSHAEELFEFMAGLFGQTPPSRQTEPRAFPMAYRLALWETRPHICGICGGEIDAFENCHVDHIRPWSKGGRTCPDNAQLTHARCNISKGNKEAPNAKT